MSLQDQIAADLKEAMKARDQERKAVLRSVKAALDKEAIDTGSPLDETAEIIVIRRQHKQRKESAEIYTSGNETERAAIELAEAEVIASYLPTQLAAEELAKHIDTAIATTAATTPGDQGKVMGHLAGVLAGRADMKEVATAVRARLSP